MQEHWVKVIDCDEEYQAEIIKQKLREYGIPSIMVDKRDDAFKTGFAEVRVPSEHLAEAQKVLAAH